MHVEPLNCLFANFCIRIRDCFCQILLIMRANMGSAISFVMTVAVILSLSVLPFSASATASSLIGISPGASSGTQALSAVTDSRCPTFSWASPVNEGTLHLTVFEVSAPTTTGVDQPAVATEPVLEKLLPAGAISWTPPLDRCFQRGWLYAWAVRLVSEGSAGEWSEPMFFQVPSKPSTAEVRAALQIIESKHQLLDEDMIFQQPGDVGATIQHTQAGLPSGSSLAPTATGITAEPGDTVGVVVGVHGVSDSVGTGSAGLVGHATASSNFTIGVYGVSASAGGAAGVFENTAGGTIIAGYGDGIQVFDVDGNGTFTALKFNGGGAGITDVGDLDCSAVSTPNLGCIDGATEIAWQTIGPDNIAGSAVKSEHIKSGAIRSSDIATGGVSAPDILDLDVGASEIASNAVGSSELDDRAVSSRAIADGSIGNTDIAANAVTYSIVNGSSSIGRLYEEHSDCANPGDLVLDGSCPSSSCTAGLFLNCSGACNQASSQTCFNSLVGRMLDPAISN